MTTHTATDNTTNQPVHTHQHTKHNHHQLNNFLKHTHWEIWTYPTGPILRNGNTSWTLDPGDYIVRDTNNNITFHTPTQFKNRYT